MARTFYTLLKSDEDGNPLKILSETDLDVLLSDPEENYGIEHFMDASWLGANKDPMYWKDNVCVLMRCEVVVPEPSGKYVLPKETNDRV
jgi:hypothetical protein